ncbi:hypothetical protein J2X72_003904 [Phyllobacterium sp. 1468]|uniref:hypothetical protein n=1 Tax=Phyllobacterium sp. 1468 TaxID=2817759 RepID=UPI002854D89D|nr:hypothetical protein [Phyllobacterium sp. 1468]MDR6635092.1 hypothetical protein [Phyllobacterium sp. 1468]
MSIDRNTPIPNWLCVSVLVLGLLLNIQPVFDLVVRALGGGLAPGFATLLSAVIGFTGVIFTTRAGFKNLIASQEAQSARDRDARAHQQEMAVQAKTDEREYEKKVLAAALQGELIALLSRVHDGQAWLRMQTRFWKIAAADKDLKDVDVPFSFPSYHVPAFEANIQRLGLLGPSIAGDVVSVFGMATNKTAEPMKAIKPAMAAMLAEGLLDAHKDWSDRIVRVGGRLGSIQGFLDDPGSLWELKKEKEAAAKAAEAAASA